MNQSLKSDKQNLKKLAEKDQAQQIIEFYAREPNRVEAMTLSCPLLQVDFSKNLISEHSLQALLDVKELIDVESKLQAMFNGEPINHSEKRAARHTLLRSLDSDSIPELSKPIFSAWRKNLKDIYSLSEKFKKGEKRLDGKTEITHVLVIGIGGSHLGSELVCNALDELAQVPFQIKFLVNTDPIGFSRIIKEVDIKKCLFIIISKSFMTHEVEINGEHIKELLKASGLKVEQLNQRFLAVTKNIEKAKAFGVPSENIFPLWEWVGGRYSVWSCAALPIILKFGESIFEKFLIGGNCVDKHLRETSINKNIPKWLALLNFWNDNFLGAESLAIVPYDERLSLFPAYIQQLEMESNGKSVDNEGAKLIHKSAPVVFGGNGTSAQHNFFQAIHQGNKLVPVDFIVTLSDGGQNEILKRFQIANCFAQSSVMMKGDSKNKAHYRLAGNRPSNTIILNKLDPSSLGALISLYEHKTIISGFLKNSNPFDQWGVERGKTIAAKLNRELNSFNISNSYDPSTKSLIEKYLEATKND